MKRILHILPQFQPGGGMERVVMNYYEALDHDQFQFDILTHKIENDAYAKKIYQSGGNIYVFPEINIKTIKDISKQYNSLLQKNQYDVVHCHMANAAFIYLRYAKKNNVTVRIMHSHQNKYADKLKHALRNIPLVYLGKKFANCNVACSELAGCFLFGKEKFTLLPNGINVTKYAYNTCKRIKFRKEINVEDDVVILGIIGRLVPQKNLFFGLKVFAECRELFGKAKLVIAGDGELKEELKRYAENSGIESDIFWLGNRNDIDIIDNGIDILLMPSLYEGLGLSIIEAQDSGVQCFASDRFPPESNSGVFYHQIPLSSDSKDWAEQIYRIYRENKYDRSIGIQQACLHGFDISDTVQKLECIYRG